MTHRWDEPEAEVGGAGSTGRRSLRHRWEEHEAQVDQYIYKTLSDYFSVSWRLLSSSLFSLASVSCAVSSAVSLATVSFEACLMYLSQLQRAVSSSP